MSRKPLRFMALCLTPSIIPSVTALLTAVRAARAMDLMPRAPSSCGAQGFFPCSQMPPEFCCPKNSDCIVFNDAQSVLCCPNGQDCSTIAPITCDIQQQNVTLNPAAQVHTTSLDGSLETCGDSCCPRGFTCQFAQCILKESISSSSAGSSTTSISPASATESSLLTTPTLSFTLSSEAPRQTSTSQPAVIITDGHCEKFPVAAIMAGFFPGVIAGVLFTILVIICVGRRRASRPASSGFSSSAATVSDPIYHPQNIAYRTDFLRRGSRSKTGTSSRTSRVRSLFSRSPTIKQMGPFGYSGVKTPVRSSIRTPVRTPEMRREPSTESIKIYSPPNERGIYSPPNGGLGRPTTTFTDMMADAGFRPGEPYMEVPGRLHSRR